MDARVSVSSSRLQLGQARSSAWRPTVRLQLGLRADLFRFAVLDRLEGTRPISSTCRHPHQRDREPEGRTGDRDLALHQHLREPGRRIPFERCARRDPGGTHRDRVAPGDRRRAGQPRTYGPGAALPSPAGSSTSRASSSMWATRALPSRAAGPAASASTSSPRRLAEWLWADADFKPLAGPVPRRARRREPGGIGAHGDLDRGSHRARNRRLAGRHPLPARRRPLSRRTWHHPGVGRHPRGGLRQLPDGWRAISSSRWTTCSTWIGTRPSSPPPRGFGASRPRSPSCISLRGRGGAFSSGLSIDSDPRPWVVRFLPWPAATSP